MKTAKARMTKIFSTTILIVMVMLVAGLLPFDAYAQGFKWAPQSCKADGTLFAVFCTLSDSFRFVPKTLVVIAYVSAVVMTIIGLLNLKSYADDPSSVPIRSILMKFVLAAFLIGLPIAMEIAISSLTGSRADENYTSNSAPCMMRGSRLMQLRGGGGGGGC